MAIRFRRAIVLLLGGGFAACARDVVPPDLGGDPDAGGEVVEAASPDAATCCDVEGWTYDTARGCMGEWIVIGCSPLACGHGNDATGCYRLTRDAAAETTIVTPQAWYDGFLGMKTCPRDVAIQAATSRFCPDGG
ncbi:MAG: hypothetical protein KIT84_28160 [Labilithrix sp.]|nr:hypothetical protein [Labilithrix sp.]MCW5814933.1 hypothetical protein [Labilithrix sp.]